MLSSVRDIQILRGNGSGKTTLVSGDLRLAAALIGKEFHLFFFPDGVQRLRRVVAGFIGDFSATFWLSTCALASLSSSSNSAA